MNIKSGHLRSTSTLFAGQAGETHFVPAHMLVNYEGAFQFGIYAQAVSGSVKISASLAPIEVAKEQPALCVDPVTLTTNSIELLPQIAATLKLEFVTTGAVYLWGI